MPIRRALQSLFLALCGALAAAAPAVAQAPQKVTLHHYPGAMLSLVTYVGVEQNLFKKHGLEVQLAGIPAGTDALSALLAGGVDVMLNSGDNFIRALEKGSPEMRVVVGNVKEMPFSVVVRSDLPLPAGSPLEAMKSLAGKKLGVLVRGGSTDIIFRALLAWAGVNPDDATWIPVGGPSTAIPAMLNKQIDAYLAFEPFQTTVVTQSKGGRIVLDMRKGQGPGNLVDFPYNFYIAKAETLASRPDMIRRLVAAFVEAHAFMQNPANLGAVVASAAKYIKMDEALLKQMIVDNLPTYSPNVTEAGMAKWTAFARSSLGVTKDFKPADLIARDFVPRQ